MDAYHTELARQRAEGRHDWGRLERAAWQAARERGMRAIGGDHRRLLVSEYPTPVTLPVVPGPEMVAAFHRAQRVRRNAQLVALGAVIVACLAAMLFGGCGAQQTPAPAAPPHPIVLSERVGTVAADAIEAAFGQRPHAVTLPELPTIVFQPGDAKDECLILHEQWHTNDQRELGAVRWTALYLRELFDCRQLTPFATCLRTIPLERWAYEAQYTCAARRASQ